MGDKQYIGNCGEKMSKKEKKNKLSVYLIKKEIPDNEILKDQSKIISVSVEGGMFHYAPSRTVKPIWIKGFFQDTLQSLDKELYSSSAKAIYIVKVAIKNGDGEDEQRTFALCFGYGYTMLESDSYEERFGLRVTLNTVNHEHIRGLEKRNIGISSKLSKEQTSKSSTLPDFGVDVEQDLIQGVVGEVETKYQEDFGKVISGKASLSMTVPINVENISPFLSKCYERFISEDYKANFDWIDNVAELKNIKLKEKLEEKLIERLRTNKLEKVWTAIPEILDWENIAGFQYKKNSLGYDIDLKVLLDAMPDEKNLSLDKLKREKIKVISSLSDNTINEWSLFDCLYAEIEEQGKTYVLSDKKW
ncbi:MAG: DUF6119 family protein, partial [Parvibaculales bacterium]